PSLPPHGPPNDLRTGIGQSETTIYNEGGFTALVQTPWTPPDPSIAVGPNHVVVTVNMAIGFYDKEGNEQFSANLDSTGNPGFFEELGAGDFTFDPKCFYDPIAERFVVLALEQYGSTESWITMAVSDDNDPNGVWYKYRTWSVISAGGGSTFWVDYPGFGFDGGYYYVTGNLFPLSGGGGGGTLYRVFDKTPMLAGEPVVIADVREGSHWSMQGAQHHGEAPSAYFIGRKNSTQLMVSRIDNPSDPAVVAEDVSVPENSSPEYVSNPGGSLWALDGRIMNTQFRDGSLWTAHGVLGNGADSVARWYEIEVSDSTPPVLRQSGDVTLPLGVSSFFPAIAPNKRGEVAIVTAAASNEQYPSVYIFGRAQNDTLGVMGTESQVVIGTSGADGRWGDYLDMTIDPNNDVRFWYVGEYQTGAGWNTYVGSAVITCVEDVNASGTVNISDLLALIAFWGTNNSGAEISPPYDVVDVADLLTLISSFGTCPQ
ncbi:MAG: hypothetical protein VX436_02800, partial [Planctomycetota bacterium]|nr:hypothetical protein [Planctomycetota bacterium]